ncbi:hypothetical protein AVV29_gp017 [Vibrio phage phi 3]|uniref:Uncharacterized protein n=1 Tax=Vibrio phage phi 3 TaxID=1589298 RepID=A0A0B5HE46_9CAUD|nr:hypothetical protein AVV29_gp017 [Vibrio phage phi 3]AJF40785.1 hypothetical protein SBVP3_0017 [Vibrio phage phi 3]
MKNTRKLEVGQVRMIPDGEYPVYYVVLEVDKERGKVKVKILEGDYNGRVAWWNLSIVTTLDVVVM